ncbi:MAG: hypothetical protein MK212_08070 [Saprospiraceae bacterium]|nr:hypothetical protein [Saprospiraceae bacterium]
MRFSTISALTIIIIGWLISWSPILTLYMEANQQRISIFNFSNVELGFAFTSLALSSIIAISAVYAFVLLWKASNLFDQYEDTGIIRFINTGFKLYSRFWKHIGFTLTIGLLGFIGLFFLYVL